MLVAGREHQPATCHAHAKICSKHLSSPGYIPPSGLPFLIRLHHMLLHPPRPPLLPPPLPLHPHLFHHCLQCTVSTLTDVTSSLP